jgi:Mrp family chromosome partitioning ATPase
VALLDLDWRKLDAVHRTGVGRGPAPTRGSGPAQTEPLLPAPDAPTLLVGASGGPFDTENPRERIGGALSIVDLVIVDTPALSATRDALGVAAAVQAALIVVSLDQTPEFALGEARAALQRAGVRPAGVVLFERRPSQRGGRRLRRRARRRSYGAERATVRA